MTIYLFILPTVFKDGFWEQNNGYLGVCESICVYAWQRAIEAYTTMHYTCLIVS